MLRYYEMLINYYFRMYSWFSTYVILLSYLIVIADDFRILSYPADDGSDIKSHVVGTRWYRSVPGIAGSIVKAFMKGAKEVPTNSPVYRKFLKQGSDSDAVDDFNSLNSEIVKGQGYGAVGVIGDTKVRLKLRDKRNNKLPTVQIWDPNMAKPIKIVYINKPIL